MNHHNFVKLIFSSFIKIKVVLSWAHLVTPNINFNYVWYHGGYVKITTTQCDFLKATFCSFCKIIVDHRDFDVIRRKTIKPKTP